VKYNGFFKKKIQIYKSGRSDLKNVFNYPRSADKNRFIQYKLFSDADNNFLGTRRGFNPDY